MVMSGSIQYQDLYYTKCFHFCPKFTKTNSAPRIARPDPLAGLGRRWGREDTELDGVGWSWMELDLERRGSRRERYGYKVGEIENTH